MELLEKNDFVLIKNNFEGFSLIKKEDIFSIEFTIKKRHNEEQSFLNSLREKLKFIVDFKGIYSNYDIDSDYSIKNYLNKFESFFEFFESYKNFNYILKEELLLKKFNEHYIFIKENHNINNNNNNTNNKSKGKIDKVYMNDMLKNIYDIVDIIDVKIKEFDIKGKYINDIYINLYYKDKVTQVNFMFVETIREIEEKFQEISSLILETLNNIKSNIIFNEVILSLLIKKEYLLNKGNENGYYFN